MQKGEDADLAALDDVLAEAHEVAGAGGAGVDAGRDGAGPPVGVRVDAERGAAPVDVGVQVDEARGDDLAGNVVDVGAIGFEVLAQGGDDAVLEADVGDPVQVLRRVNDASAAEEQGTGHAA